MSKQNIIELLNVCKRYTVTHQKPTLIGGLIHQANREEFWALKDVSLTIRKGDRIGIIGHNGAGKSTLLKIIAGITKPTTGIVKTNGKIVALMDLEAGFHPDLTGEENIYINGMLVGMSRSEIESKKQQIIRFADIGNYINAPFYTYSSGMKFRIAFAVAMASQCEVLILDEVFMSGDHRFQANSISRLHYLQNQRHITTIICSHISFLIWGLAETFYQINKGTISKKQHEVLYKENSHSIKLLKETYKLKALF